MSTELYVSVKTSDLDEYYIVPFQSAVDAFEAELNNHLAMEGPGLTVAFEVVELTEEEYLALPEFQGKVSRGGYK